jgi:AraC-like DNA-binding protein
LKINSTILKAVHRICATENLHYKAPNLPGDDLIECLIPIDSLREVMQSVLQREDYSKWGSFIGSQMTVHDLGVLGHYLLACKHTFFAKEKLEKYQLLISDLVSFQFEVKESTVEWSLTTPFMQQLSHYKTIQFLNDLEIALRHNIILELTKGKFHPSAVHVMYEYTEEHARFLQEKYKCAILFDQEVSMIHYHFDDINGVIPSANFYMYTHAENVLIDLLQKWYQESGSYTLVTKRFILSNMGRFTYGLETVADRMNISTRHFQRQLQQEGTNYNEILEECRREMSVVYLHKGMRNKEIAHRLGYSETNSFIRAFKKWFGKSAREYKKTVIS